VSPVRKVRYAVIGLNLLLVGAIGVAAFALVRGPVHEPFADHDPTAYALEDRAHVSRDLSVIPAALDRALPPKVEQQAPVVTPNQTLAPPPALTLVALLPDEFDDRQTFAIVDRGGVQKLLKEGDVVQQGAERWRVAAVRFETIGSGTLAKLTLETDARVHNYEAMFRQEE
jgi:hypothetical protein